MQGNTNLVGIHFVMASRPEFRGWNAVVHGVHGEWQKFVRSEWAWLVQTFYELEGSGLPVTASAEPQASKINVIHADDYLSLDSKADFFAAVVIADRRVYYPGNCLLVQNRKQGVGAASYCIPHWNQPGLIPRVTTTLGEKDGFHIAFAGIPANTVRLEEILAGARFDRPVRLSTLSPDEWNDFSTIDALVAVRDFEGNGHPEKPPTKLFNAWCAGVPFIGGMDCAYEQVGRPGIDYLQVSTRQQLIETIARLQDQQVWQSFVREGAKASETYGRESTRATWLNVLSGPIQEQFNRWENSSRLGRQLSVWAHGFYFNSMRLRRRYLMLKGQY